MANEFIARKGLIALSDSQITGSLTVSDKLTIQGDISTTGDIIANNYIINSTVTNMTQSFSSGSTIFGDSSDDTHQFTGSVSISGSLTSEAGDDKFVIENGTFKYYDSTGDHYLYLDQSGTHDVVFKSNLTGELINLSLSTNKLNLKQPTGIGNPSSISSFERLVIKSSGTLPERHSFRITDSSNNTFFKVSDNSKVIIGSDGIPTASLDITGDLRVSTHITASGNINASGTIVGSNLSGTNTGDQDLSSYATITELNTSSSALQTNIDTNTTNISTNTTDIATLTAATSSYLTSAGTTFPYTGSAIISGSLEVIGKVTGSILIEGSGSTLFEVVGSEGQLFSITDNLSGSLFAVSDVSGLPILEVFSDDTVKIGTFNSEGIIVNGTDVTIGGVLTIPGFADVSASLAAASAGGDNLGNHTATQNLNMGTYAITNVGNVDGVDISALNSTVSTNTSNISTNTTDIASLTAATSSYSTATGVENNADVTDTTNVTAAGALMDSEVTSLSGIKTLTVPDNTTISTFGASLIDDTNAASARATLGLGSMALQISTDYVSINGDTLEGDLDFDSSTNYNIINIGEVRANTISGSTFVSDGVTVVSTPDVQTVKIGQSAGGSGPMRVSIVSSDTQYGLFGNDGIQLTGSVGISSTLSIPGFADVSASLASLTSTDYVLSINSELPDIDGDVSLSTSEISEGSNQYYTDARVKTKLNADNVVSGSATQVRSFLNVADGATANTGTVDTSGTPASTQVAVFTDADTIQGTNKLIFTNSALEVAATNSDSSTIKIYGGVVGSAQPYISPTGGHTNLRFGDATSNLTFDFQNNKIAFDQDTTNTYIMADTDTPENLEIHADGNIELRADDNLQVFSNIDVNSFAISNVTSITGSDSAAIELNSYPIGYEAVSAFPITGSGLIIRETGLPANNYPMLKIGDVELVDINSGLSPNVFFIHNVDSFLVASGSEPVNIFGDGPNKLFEHDGDAFKVYTKGIDSAKLTVESGSVTIASADLSLAGKLYNVANETTIDYIAGYTGLPNPSPTYDLSVQSVSSVIANTNREFDTGSSALSSNGGSLGDIVKFGGSTTIAGGLYYLNSSGGWTLAQADAGGTSTGSLAVALGTNSTTDGMLLRGFVNPYAIADAGIGAPVYVASASAGRFSGLPSQQTGEIVRVVGHAYGSDLVYFNPSNNWIEL